MSIMRHRIGWTTYFLVLFSLLYGVFLLALDDRPLTNLYATSPYHRQQADVLLHGHFYLSDSIEDIQPGLAWHNGKVQQVWGLGVAIWLLPFEAIAHLFGKAFPDRIALGLAFALLAFFAGSTGLTLIRDGKRAFGIGLLWLVILCPSLWTLARNSELIFEETVLYALILSLGIQVSLARVILFGSRADYWLCCALSAFAVWVRPTHAVYGGVAVIIASVLLWKRRAGWRPAGGLLLFVFSGMLLAWTNSVRFGSSMEFGHRLTVSTGSMVYLTRFGNPFKEAPVQDAAKELFGVLFLNSNVRGAGAFSEDLFPFQAQFPRWRRLDFSTFDVNWLVLILAAMLAGGTALFRKCPKAEKSFVFSLLTWSFLSLFGLAGFYLYYPATASRYLLDFAPAFMGLIAIISWECSPRWPRLASTLFAAWLIVEICSASSPVSEEMGQNRTSNPTLSRRNPAADFAKFDSGYSLSQHPLQTGIPSNGSGWDVESGFAADVVTLIIEQPRFLELIVSDRRMQNGEPAREDVYRAQIDGYSLQLEKIEKEEDIVKVRFKVPELILARQQPEVVFLCFSQGLDDEDRNSERILHSVRWR